MTAWRRIKFRQDTVPVKKLASSMSPLMTEDLLHSTRWTSDRKNDSTHHRIASCVSTMRLKSQANLNPEKVCKSWYSSISAMNKTTAGQRTKFEAGWKANTCRLFQIKSDLITTLKLHSKSQRLPSSRLTQELPKRLFIPSNQKFYRFKTYSRGHKQRVSSPWARKTFNFTSKMMKIE